jgi:uncharacterized protein
MNDMVGAPTIGRTTDPKQNKGVLLAPIAMLARQEKTWSSSLLLGVLWRAMTNVGTILDVYRLARLQPFNEVARKNPRFALKYLTHDYLARSLSVRERASCFLHHHKRMHRTLSDAFLRTILLGDITLYEIENAGTCFALTIALNRPHYSDKEGEWLISLTVDAVTVFVLSFTVVPGRVVDSATKEVILVSGLQGIPGCYAKIRLATKSLCDVAPSALLVAALQGIATTLGIGELASVSGSNQSCYSNENDAVFKSAYDEFFTEIGLTQNGSGFLTGTLPLPEKPMSSIKKGHKLRTKEKRAFKREIMLASEAGLGRGIAHSGQSPAGIS